MRDSSDEPRRTLGARQTQTPETEPKEADSRDDRPQGGLRRLGVELAAPAARPGTSPTPGQEREVTPKTVEALLGDQHIAAIHSSTEHTIAGSGPPAMNPSAVKRSDEGIYLGSMEADPIISASAANEAGTDAAITGGSEYERSLRELAPFVDGQRLGRLEAPEVEALARETAVPADQVRTLAMADRLGRQHGNADASVLAPAPVPAPLWYAWLRVGIGSDPDTVWSQPTQVLIQAVGSAISRRIIPADTANQPGQITE